MRNPSTGWNGFTAFFLTYWFYKAFRGIPANDYGDFPIAVVVHLVWLVPLVVLFRGKVFECPFPLLSNLLFITPLLRNC